jgi:hypothetical protein
MVYLFERRRREPPRRFTRRRRMLRTMVLNADRAALAAGVFFPVEGPQSVRPPRRPMKVRPLIVIFWIRQSESLVPRLWKVTM